MDRRALLDSLRVVTHGKPLPGGGRASLGGGPSRWLAATVGTYPLKAQFSVLCYRAGEKLLTY